MDEYKTRCINCGKLLCEDDEMWQVLHVKFSCGIERILSPTCSRKCAEEISDKNTVCLRSLAREVSNQNYRHGKVRDFFSF